jgi:CO/xanthine dehydrogenase FAD-binding subunit
LQFLRFTDPGKAAAAAGAESARILGGGTLVIRALNMGDATIASLVRLDEEAGGRIVVSGDGSVVLGGRVTMAEVARHPGLGWLAPVALSVGGPAVRNMATVAGNLHAPSPYGDFATALLALDAVVALSSQDGDIELPIEVFLAARTSTHARSLIRTIRFTMPAAGAFAYRKVSRSKPKGVAVLTIALVVGVGRDRIAFGALAAAPVRCREAEAILSAGTIDEAATERAATAAADAVNPSDDPVSSGWYKRAVLPVHLRRLLQERCA